MTDNLLYKLEEKVVLLLTELEDLRKEVSLVKHENATLKAEKVSHAHKLQGLVSLLDAIDAAPVNDHGYAPLRMEEAQA